MLHKHVRQTGKFGTSYFTLNSKDGHTANIISMFVCKVDYNNEITNKRVLCSKAPTCILQTLLSRIENIKDILILYVSFLSG